MSNPLSVIVILFAVILLVYVIAAFNRLIRLRNHIREAWGNIDTELKRRYELIPNLVSAVKGYAAHEREVLERVTALRTQCMASHGSPSEQERDEVQLVQALKALLVIVEAYPEIKADQHYLELQRELVMTEDRIQAARRFYNGNIRDYRNACETFPSLLIASLFGFRPEAYFSVEPAVREAPSAAA